MMGLDFCDWLIMRLIQLHFNQPIIKMWYWTNAYFITDHLASSLTLMVPVMFPAAAVCIVWICLLYDPRAGRQLTPCSGADLFPMGPPGLRVSPAPRASQDQRWLLEVQPHTSHHIYGAASLVLLTILCLPHQQHSNSSGRAHSHSTDLNYNYSSSYGDVLLLFSPAPG